MDAAQLREQVEKLYKAEVAAILPLNYEIVRLASSGIFVNRYPDHPMTLALQAGRRARDVVTACGRSSDRSDDCRILTDVR